jgi:serine/threonine-protein kinase
MLPPEGGPILLDLGLDFRFLEEDPESDPEREPILFGRPPYMPPQRIEGRASGPADDVWAFGCILFEMLAGRRPFSGGTIMEVMMGIVQQEPDWKALPADTPPRLRELLRRCLHKKPADRPADLLEVARELEQIAADPTAPVPSTRRWWKPWTLFSSR